MPKEKKTDPNRISGRLEPQLRADLDELYQTFGGGDTGTLTQCLQAFVRAAKSEGAVRFPLTILMAEKPQLQAAAEDAAPYPEPSPTAIIEAEEASRRYDAARARAARKKRGAGPRKSATGGP